MIEGVQDAEIEKWADNRITVWMRKDQICERIRQKIVNIILSGPIDVEKQQHRKSKEMLQKKQE